MPLAIMANRLDPPSFQPSDLNIFKFVNADTLTTDMNFIRKKAGDPMDRFPESADLTRWESPSLRTFLAISFSFVLIARHRLMNEIKNWERPPFYLLWEPLTYAKKNENAKSRSMFHLMAIKKRSLFSFMPILCGLCIRLFRIHRFLRSKTFYFIG